MNYIKNHILEKLDSSTVFKNPWCHCIIDDFLTEEILSPLIHFIKSKMMYEFYHSESDEKDKKSGDILYLTHYKNNKASVFKRTSEGSVPYHSDNDCFEKIHLLNSVWSESDIFKKLCEMFGDAFEEGLSNKIRVTIRAVAPSDSFAPHTDGDNRFVSVIYLNPEKSTGTDLYRMNEHSKKEYYSSVDWKVNRALLFRNRREYENKTPTYHGWKVPSSQSEPRVVMSTFMGIIYDKD